MVKVIKNFSLDAEIVEDLAKVENASSLVNNLLKQHFDKETYELMDIATLKQLIDITEKKEQLEKQIKELERNARAKQG